MNIQPVITSLPPPQSSQEASSVTREAQAIALAQEKVKTVQPIEPASREQLNAAVKSVREYIEPFNNALEFSLDDETGQMVVKIIDRDTKEVIRQMPSEEMIAIAKALDTLKGLFVKQTA